MDRGVGRWLPAVAVLLVGIVLSFVASELIGRIDDARVRSVLDQRADWRARDLERRFQLAIDSIEALSVFLAVEKHVDADQFHQFVHLAHGSAELASSVVWLPWVPGNQRDAVTAAARDAGVDDFHILFRDERNQLVEESDRDGYLPVLFQEIFDDRPGPIGFDVLSLPERQGWVTQARDTGKPVITRALVLPMGAESPLGFVMLWPVYMAGAPTTTIDERRSAFRGVTLARFRFDRALSTMIAASTPKPDEAIDFYIAADASDAAPIQAAHYDPASAAIVTPPKPTPAQADSITVERDLDLFGRHWTLVSHFSPAIVTSLRSYDRRLSLAFGLILTAILAFYIERERRRHFATRDLVEERTRDLARELEERREAEAGARRSQELVSSTLEAAPFAIISLKTDGTVMLWNRAAERIFGYTSEEAIGKFMPIVTEEEQAEFSQAIDAMRAGTVIRDQPMHRRRKDGTVIEVRFSGAPVYEDGQLRAFVGMLEDVTQSNARERQLIQAQKMNAIGNLTGGMAHDFNNLLGIIVGNLDLARTGALPDGMRELVEDGLRAALRGAELTRRLLAFARRQPLKPERVEINGLVKEILELLSRTLGEAVEIKANLSPEVWPVVIDPAQLEASLANLATNARDAMPTGGRLMIATENRHLDRDYTDQFPDVRPGDYVLIEVSDTGTGIAPDIIGRVFEPFFTTKPQGKGTGLGLSMVFGFVKQSGGHLNVYSELGAGTTFRLYLPRALAGATQEAAESRPDIAPSAGETILVVEDNPGMRRVVVRQLQGLGYRVRDVENGPAALEFLAKETADLLFSDVVMPGEMDGYELARRVTARWPRIKIVLTSGFPEAKLNGGFENSLHLRLLSKPYRRDDLARLLRDVLDQ
jgi:PAS domain S-box-containing protein